MKKIIIIILVLVIFSMFIFDLTSQKTFEQKRTNILNSIYSAIDDAGVEGRYKCCIDPPCTMCYLGNWVWEDGSCYCDDMMVEEEWDKVCPQCEKGIEEGRCKSSLRDVCEV